MNFVLFNYVEQSGKSHLSTSLIRLSTHIPIISITE